ncbi:lysophospholipase catalytic domain-containing protein [Scheffersomyces coipomensis]|uniref:lysophospholipase catalytic domain-containing protein n=1 Tax=Scheffersomyces coipomensis TaxID=1788519 RepID=UPI00315DA5F3
MHHNWVIIFIIYIFLLDPASGFTFRWPWSNNSSSSSSSSTATSSDLGTASASATNTAHVVTEDGVTTTLNPYSPYNTSCPDGSLIREASGISEEEQEYLENRHEITNQNLINFFNNRANLTDFDAESFINDYSHQHNITIGLAFSGGGYRAMLNGAGQLLALDDRYNASDIYGIGGLLQSSTYLVGLSGGNWLVGSVVLNDWISVNDILDGSIEIWNLDNSIFNPAGINVFETLSYYYGIQDAIAAKLSAGFDTSITDIWGRALSNQFFPGTFGGENITFSSIQNLSSFQNHEMPFPIVVANGRTPGTMIINENSTVFEISPFELGSWDPSLNSFVDLQFIGTEMVNGIPNTTNCIVNFDNAGFVMGTSSSLFNQALLRLGGTSLNSAIKAVLNSILGVVSYNKDDIAAYEPNPFYGVEHAGSEAIVSNRTLFLVDGGEDQQNVPFYPLIQQSRSVDVIFGFDNSADTELNWPNGTSIMMTYLRQFSAQGKGTPFPPVPDVQTFLDQNLGETPVFFGCDANNLTALINYHDNKAINETDIPLVVLLSNNRIVTNSNFSTYKMSYSEDEIFQAIENGYEVASQLNVTDDWPACVGCAIIRRQQERLGIEQSDQCKQCFDQFCWTGGFAEAAQPNVNLTVFDLAGTTSTSKPKSSSLSTSTSSSSSSSSSHTSTKHNDASSTQIGQYVSVWGIILACIALI